MAAQREAVPALRDQAQHSTGLFQSALQEFLSAEIGEALSSGDAVLRPLAYLDQRLGKRRLKSLAAMRPKTELEVRCLCVRLEREGMTPRWPEEES